MAKRQYKNVFTIMEKVKKGELDFTGSSRFTKILDSYKKPELVQPYMHYLDVYRLNEYVKKYFSHYPGNSDKLHQTEQSIRQMRGRETWNFSMDDIDEAYKSLPASLKNDIFNMFNKPIDKIDFSARTDKNQMRYKLLELANDPSLKILTEGSNAKSGMFTQSMLTYLTYFMLRLKAKDQDAYEEMKKQLNQGDGDCKDGDKDNDSAEGQSGTGSGQGKSQKQMQKAIDQALQQTKNALDQQMRQMADTVNELSENLGDEELEDSWVNTKGMGGMSKEDLERAISSLKKIKMNENLLKASIKKILDKSKNYFSGAEKITYDSLFETGNFDGLEEYAFLHPKLRTIFPEDITTKNVERRGKVNLYVDISGSMSDGCGVKDTEGRQMTKLDFAKAIALVMKKNKMLNKLYEFNSNIMPLKNTDFAIAAMNQCGGTNITKVVDHIIKSNENSLVLTDAEDRCNLYTDKVFFLGVKGSNFGYFHQDVLPLYHQNQMAVFNGDKILSVNAYGKTY